MAQLIAFGLEVFLIVLVGSDLNWNGVNDLKAIPVDARTLARIVTY